MDGFVFAEKAAEIAREAGALLKSFYQRGVAMEYKGDVDLVTEADRASEALIVARLNAVFPEHGVYGKRVHATAWSASTAGMSTRSMAPPTSPRLSRLLCPARPGTSQARPRAG